MVCAAPPWKAVTRPPFNWSAVQVSGVQSATRSAAAAVLYPGLWPSPEERFVREYLIDLNATQAAIRAGYSAKTARVIGAQNLSKLNISKKIEEAQTKRAGRSELTGDMVVEGPSPQGLSAVK